MPLDDQSELFYWVDEHDHVLGSILRGQAHDGSNKIHRSASILVLNQKNQMLLQQRSLSKDSCPGYWGEAVGEHVKFGETYHQAALRGGQEELGLSLKLKYIGKSLDDLGSQREYATVYKSSLNLTPTHFDRDEIQTLLWVNITDLSQFVNTHLCTVTCKIACQMAGYLK
jgi:isopentenyldiphosphate isomerase